MRKKEEIKTKNTKLSMTIAIVISILIMIIQPVSAWGDIAHMAIDSQLKGVPKEVTSYASFTNGGGVGTDMFFFLKGAEGYSVLSHTVRPADLGREMLKIASDAHSDKQKAFAYGWLSHGASDIVGHRDYINPRAGSDMIKHSEVEIGVDANLADSTDISFSVPYRLIQDAYRNIYGDANVPSYNTIYDSVKIETASLFIEKELIKIGLFNNLKTTYGDFQPVYTDSINYSTMIINNASLLPNVDFSNGLTVATGDIPVVSDTSISNELNKQIKNDIRDISIESIKDQSIDIPIEDDKINQYILTKEPIIKDKKVFENIKNKIKDRIKQRISNTKIDELKRRFQNIIDQINTFP